ncbi:MULTISPECIES: 2-phosphosulfolactate phosphatase family protein [unclassified Prochlorococcus]|uniref:2-phosphosulfolactate phosphatase family protein n=1 Tax=unclassified Prochlorococcus TaxID=2627481 RepID=UPI000533B1F9|nr:MULTISPECIES: 2-phosphosulfolactate phosphatase family protein [unclassified Prochlorococcus]KGG15370.1 putative 2-phosphosulfolactate phosphatasee [Prochlorococcus sp. MIT 0602]KGG17648.1 putative 2-phosphosulfolactate phosphatasee [Prochlorococcus sp. MIT 0603]
MRLSYFHVADNVPFDAKPKTSIVIDVLRATTTIACALNNGAEAVQTFADIIELRKESSFWPSSKRLLLGERGGKKLEGFDLGNSPVDVSTEVVSGKRLFMSTTNGTRSLERVKHSLNLYTMSLVNRRAVGEKLLLDDPEDVLILGSGWEGSYSLEDSLAAGALASFLCDSDTTSCQIINDELIAAMSLWSQWRDNIQKCLRNSTHGQRLERLGNHDDDFLCCSELDTIDIVPIQRGKTNLFSL